ncbi:hypothetical protein BXY66_3178 [Shimia isoporae]|uniref:Uncharacterized protein n=1 Tax=Shimia isoporae TaxID=647720 RepID=A0A4R1N4B3_9RHOB|nr:hypothetical protein [Shimia isoporae]TCL00535.1 hypothetical protein BXY66_3178 [Shimia isoporae]
MIRAVLHAGARAFGRKYAYDTDYMHEVIDTSVGAGLALTLFPMLSQHRGPQVARAVWFGALLASTLDGDCGPCGQLVVDMALEQGVSADHLLAAIEARFSDAGDVGLGFQFAQQAIARSYDANEFADTIRARFGDHALVAASFAAATGRFYPVFKRGLGQGHACQRIDVGGRLGEVA